MTRPPSRSSRSASPRRSSSSRACRRARSTGTEDKDISITFPNGNTRQFTGQGLLFGNSLPNFFFHATTAYDILRQLGVELGKRDFMGPPPG